MTTYSDILYHMGGVPVMFNLPFTRDSKYYFVDPARGSNTNDGLTPDRALADCETGEDHCTANQHDAVVYLAGATGDTLSAAVTWDKSYTHLVGVCAPTQVAQRARLHYETGTTAASPLLEITASGCIFKNFYIFDGIASASNLINVQVSGGRNYFENVHFAGGGNATQAVDGGCSLRLVGSEGENTFVNCTVGVDTVAASTGMMAMRIYGGTARNIFRKCNFTMYAGSTGAGFIEWEALSAVDRYMLFEDCMFLNTGTSTMASAFIIPASVPSHRRMFMVNCYGHGFTDWDASDRCVLYFAGGTATAGGYTGFFQASAVT